MPASRRQEIPKNAIVTGGSKRIGAAIATHLAQSGTNVIVHHHQSDEEAEALCQKLAGTGIRAIPVQADLSNSDETTQFFEDCVSALGSIDLLVNNASLFEPDMVTEPDDLLWDTHFAIHVKAPSILAGKMAQQNDLPDGLIVNLIDQRVRRLTPNFYSYTLSKSALWTATQTLAQKLAPRIRVNAIGPGPTLPNERQNDEDFAKQTDALILKRSPDLSEFGETVSYFWAAKSVTGQLIALDGGQHLAWETPDVVGINE